MTKEDCIKYSSKSLYFTIYLFVDSQLPFHNITEDWSIILNLLSCSLYHCSTISIFRQRAIRRISELEAAAVVRCVKHPPLKNKLVGVFNLLNLTLKFSVGNCGIGSTTISRRLEVLATPAVSREALVVTDVTGHYRSFRSPLLWISGIERPSSTARNDSRPNRGRSHRKRIKS